MGVYVLFWSCAPPTTVSTALLLLLPLRPRLYHYPADNELRTVIFAANVLALVGHGDAAGLLRQPSHEGFLQGWCYGCYSDTVLLALGGCYRLILIALVMVIESETQKWTSSRCSVVVGLGVVLVVVVVVVVEVEVEVEVVVVVVVAAAVSCVGKQSR